LSFGSCLYQQQLIVAARYRARDRKAEAKTDANTKQAKAAEDAYWSAAGEGSKSKAQAKKEDQERQRAEAAAKKLEAKKLAEEEEQALSRPKSATKAPRVSGPKVSRRSMAPANTASTGGTAMLNPSCFHPGPAATAAWCMHASAACSQLTLAS
jgi:hypothetical protein